MTPSLVSIRTATAAFGGRAFHIWRTAGSQRSNGVATSGKSEKNEAEVSKPYIVLAGDRRRIEPAAIPLHHRAGGEQSNGVRY